LNSNDHFVAFYLVRGYLSVEKSLIAIGPGGATRPFEMKIFQVIVILDKKNKRGQTLRGNSPGNLTFLQTGSPAGAKKRKSIDIRRKGMLDI
jgi:hypothetical protein